MTSAPLAPATPSAQPRIAGRTQRQRLAEPGPRTQRRRTGPRARPRRAPRGRAQDRQPKSRRRGASRPRSGRTRRRRASTARHPPARRDQRPAAGRPQRGSTTRRRPPAAPPDAGAAGREAATPLPPGGVRLPIPVPAEHFPRSAAGSSGRPGRPRVGDDLAQDHAELVGRWGLIGAVGARRCGVPSERSTAPAGDGDGRDEPRDDGLEIVGLKLPSAAAGMVGWQRGDHDQLSAAAETRLALATVRRALVGAVALVTVAGNRAPFRLRPRRATGAPVQEGRNVGGAAPGRRVTVHAVAPTSRPARY